MKPRAWSRPAIRAAAPPVVVAAVIAGGAIGLPARAAPDLPAKSADDVVSLLVGAHNAGVSGDVVETADLGLPALPSITGIGSATTGLVGLLDGTHALRVWVGTPGQLRAQVLDALDETEIVSDGVSLWTYVYSTNEFNEVRLPAHATTVLTPAVPDAQDADATVVPDLLADRILRAVDPTTVVTVAGTARVAGHDTYLLDVRPRTTDTTIGLVEIAVDSTTGVALRVRIFAQGASSAALTVAFSRVHFGAVDPAQFTFVPPPDAQSASNTASTTQASGPRDTTAADAPYLVGSGWQSVLVLPRSVLTASTSAQRVTSRHPKNSTASLAGLLVEGGERVTGGVLLQTTLVNVLAADDGRVLVGAVPPATLENALTEPAATK